VCVRKADFEGFGNFWLISWYHFWVIEEWMKEDRSVWVGKSPGLMRGRWVACMTALFTASLPGMPQWPGTHMKMTLDEVGFREMSRMCMQLTKGWRESGFEMAEMEAREWGADEEFWVMMFSRHRRKAWSSAVSTSVQTCEFGLLLKSLVLFFRSDWIRRWNRV